MNLVLHKSAIGCIDVLQLMQIASAAHHTSELQCQTLLHALKAARITAACLIGERNASDCMLHMQFNMKHSIHAVRGIYVLTAAVQQALNCSFCYKNCHPDRAK